MDVDAATPHYRQALALAEALAMRPLQAHCHHGLGTLYTTTGAAGAGPCCPGYRYCALPRHGHDLLAAPGQGRAGTGGRAVMDYEAVLALASRCSEE